MPAPLPLAPHVASTADLDVPPAGAYPDACYPDAIYPDQPGIALALVGAIPVFLPLSPR
jgi:hypothetical protein